MTLSWPEDITVFLCVCFQWSLYLLWRIDHTNVVSELQRSQDGGEDWENKGSRHGLKTHSNGTFRRAFSEQNTTERLSDILQLSFCDPWWHQQQLNSFNLNFPIGPWHLSPWSQQAQSSVYIPGRHFVCSWQLFSHHMVIFHDGFWWLIMYFNLLDQNKPVTDAWTIDVMKMRAWKQ